MMAVEGDGGRGAGLSSDPFAVGDCQNMVDPTASEFVAVVFVVFDSNSMAICRISFSKYVDKI